MIERLSIQHSTAIAQIHKDNLPSILSFYPVSVIKKFYEHQLSSHDKNFAFGFFEGKELSGFVFGSLEVDSIFNEYVKSDFKNFLLKTLIEVIKNPKLFVYYLSGLFSKKLKLKNKIQLVYIAADKKAGKKGIGKALLDAFEQELQRRNIHYYELEVEKNNPALSFYQKNNFVTVSEINNFLEKKYLMGKHLTE